MSEKDAFWESNLQKEQERAKLDAAGANDAGSSSDDELPILATLATKTKKKIMPHVASRDGKKPSPKAKKKPKKPHPRWVYVPVIPDQDVSSQYWDTMPSAVRVARDAANLQVHTCMEAANGAAGGEVADSKPNAADGDGEESAGGEQEGGGEEAASEAHGAFTQGHEQVPVSCPTI